MCRKRTSMSRETWVPAWGAILVFFAGEMTGIALVILMAGRT
jgi:hypothetical protein